MIEFTKALRAWGSSGFEDALKTQIQGMDRTLLPLQQGLTQSSHVGEAEPSVMILQVTEVHNVIRAKAGIFYSGVIAGSCCSDDPTPVCEQTEYCELQFDIDKASALVTVTLL